MLNCICSIVLLCQKTINYAINGVPLIYQKITWYQQTKSFAQTAHNYSNGSSIQRRHQQQKLDQCWWNRRECMPKWTLEHINKMIMCFCLPSFCVRSFTFLYLSVRLSFFSFLLSVLSSSFSQFIFHFFFFHFVCCASESFFFLCSCSMLMDMIAINDDNRSAAYNSKFTQSVFFIRTKNTYRRYNSREKKKHANEPTTTIKSSHEMKDAFRITSKFKRVYTF